ncbi:MAG: pyridoxal phosphate-dependent decarboxylase family protein, partial [Spirochaetaceae bacterium]
VEVDENYAMIPERLDEAIIADLRAGLVPCCVVATLGTTGSTAVDPLRSIGEICRRHDVWLHVDAALAGTALLLPQMRWMTDGLEYVDTFVFNPHKWMFTNFDCSAYFVRDREALTRTFEIHPEYLRTAEGRLVNNYRDWGIQLGRRFRALKLWFVIRTYGVAGIRDRVAKHLELAAEIAQRAQDAPDFELLAPAPLNTVCLRYHPTDIENTETLNALNEKLLETVNAGGEMYVTHTKLRGNYTIRFVVGQTNVERRHVEAGWDLIVRTARSLDTSAAKR